MAPDHRPSDELLRGAAYGQRLGVLLTGLGGLTFAALCVAWWQHAGGSPRVGWLVGAGFLVLLGGELRRVAAAVLRARPASVPAPDAGGTQALRAADVLPTVAPAFADDTRVRSSRLSWQGPRSWQELRLA